MSRGQLARALLECVEEDIMSRSDAAEFVLRADGRLLLRRRGLLRLRRTGPERRDWQDLQAVSVPGRNPTEPQLRCGRPGFEPREDGSPFPLGEHPRGVHFRGSSVWLERRPTGGVGILRYGLRRAPVRIRPTERGSGSCLPRDQTGFQGSSKRSSGLPISRRREARTNLAAVGSPPGRCHFFSRIVGRQRELVLHHPRDRVVLHGPVLRHPPRDNQAGPDDHLGARVPDRDHPDAAGSGTLLAQTSQPVCVTHLSLLAN